MLLWALLACIGTSDDTSEPPDPPLSGEPQRVLLITVDTLRYDHLGSSGETRPLTPNLDALAARSIRYTAAHAHAPWTKPSVSSLLTSQLPVEHGVQQWEDLLTPDQPTLATVLSGAGFVTEAAVAHSALDPESNGFHHGFDRFDTSAYDGRGYPGDFVTSKQLADAAVERLSVLIGQDEPWLLWVHFFDPHNDYFDHDNVLDLGEDPVDRYAEEIAFTDLHLGRVLDAAALADPLVVMLADHGEEWRDHGKLGHGHSLYEELVHVPLLLSGPGLEPAEVDEPIGLMDVAPTVLQYLEVEAPDSFRGVPLLPDPAPRPVFFEGRRFTELRGVLDGDLKLVWTLPDPEPQLFDLEVDPGETTDVREERPADTARLKALLVETYPDATR